MPKKQGLPNSTFLVAAIGQAAAKAVQESIYDACYVAQSIKFEGAYKGVVPSAKDYKV